MVLKSSSFPDLILASIRTGCLLDPPRHLCRPNLRNGLLLPEDGKPRTTTGGSVIDDSFLDPLCPLFFPLPGFQAHSLHLIFFLSDIFHLHHESFDLPSTVTQSTISLHSATPWVRNPSRIMKGISFYNLGYRNQFRDSIRGFVTFQG